MILLFGSLCGCLGVIGETSTRAIELWTHGRKSAWLATTRIGRTLVLCTEVVLVVLPLSLASLGELPVVSFAGVAMMVAVAAYVLQQAAATGTLTSWEGGWGDALAVDLAHLPEAASTFGYAFYIQPCALPLLRTLPPGEPGVVILERALHLTFLVPRRPTGTRWPVRRATLADRRTARHGVHRAHACSVRV